MLEVKVTNNKVAKSAIRRIKCKLDHSKTNDSAVYSPEVICRIS